MAKQGGCQVPCTIDVLAPRRLRAQLLGMNFSPVDQEALAAAVRGANVLRVHDVAPMVDAIKVWTAIRGWDEVP